jgi:transcriptional regulator GlxA family with amidase domain
MKPTPTSPASPRGGFSWPVPAWDGDRLRSPEKAAVHKVQRSIAYMNEHLDQPLQVATLAALAEVSPSHFFALFKQLTGCPPMEYFTRLRMRQACRLLDSTSASVKEVAAALGYDDPFYFSRVFKLVNRVPPSRYRPKPADVAAPPAARSRFPARSAGNSFRLQTANAL